MQGVVSIRARRVADGSFDEEFQRMLGAIDARPRLVIDRTCRVRWRSDNAERLLAPPVPLQISGGRLRAEVTAASSALADFIDSVGPDCTSLLVRGESGKHWAMVTAWSLPGPSDDVCLLMSLSVPHRGVEESGLARALRLTGAETRVLDQFARLNSPRDIAERMNVSLSTVRSHLKQIHSKAGVQSAVQLTQLVRGYCTC